MLFVTETYLKMPPAKAVMSFFASDHSGLPSDILTSDSYSCLKAETRIPRPVIAQ
jgi:hypothetical protein